jgi:hypothetical protein
LRSPASGGAPSLPALTPLAGAVVAAIGVVAQLDRRHPCLVVFLEAARKKEHEGQCREDGEREQDPLAGHWDADTV